MNVQAGTKGFTSAPIAERFWSKVERSVGCWLWTGSTAHRTKGRDYGLIWWEGRNQKAHRVAYLLAVGPVPEGLLVLHRCDTPRCVRPDHLFVGTHADNNRDMVAKGRNTTGPLVPLFCPQGHAYSDENTYFHRGHRACKECKRERNRAARRLARVAS